MRSSHRGCSGSPGQLTALHDWRHVFDVWSKRMPKRFLEAAPHVVEEGGLSSAAY